MRAILDRAPGVELSESIFNLHFDIEASRNGRNLLVEAKVTTPQTEARMSELAQQLSAVLKSYQELHPNVDNPGSSTGGAGDIAQVEDGCTAMVKPGSLGWSLLVSLG